MDFHWALEGEIATGSLPSSEEDVRMLQREGIRAVLSLHLVSFHVHQLLEDAGIEHEVRVTEDLTCPDTGAMREMDELLERWRTEGKPALVHCYMGVGRCRTVVSAHLAARIGDVRRAFLWTGRPETERQKEFVREYAEKRAQA